jgi:prepilin-type N-terminal cleavage/methylation domain-containing protein
MRTNKGMTLIELLVVLGILAALAGMTLSFVGEMNTAARQTVTRNKLDQIELAIVGDSTHSSRFLNDMGRLPVSVDEIIVNGKSIKEEGIVLSELWHSELFDTPSLLTLEYHGYNNDEIGDKKTYPTTYKLDHDPFIVTLNGGWKGPYLNVTNKKLYDGFGNGFWVAKNENELDELEDQEMIELNPDGTILRFGSLGEDNSKDKTETETWQNQDMIKEFRRSQVFATLHVNILLRDSSTNPATWLPPMKVGIENDLYVDSKEYKFGSVIKVDTELFVCTSAQSVTTSTAPNWKRNEIIIDEGGREWIWLPRSNALNHLRVTVFSPYVTPDTRVANMKITTAFSPPLPTSSVSGMWEGQEEIWNNNNHVLSDPNWKPESNSLSEVTFHNLTPGIRKIFAYGYVESGTSPNCTYSNARHSNVQTIELKPGENFMTIYLQESFFD